MSAPDSVPNHIEASPEAADAARSVTVAPPDGSSPRVPDAGPRSPTYRQPRTRTGIVWFGLCAATATFVVLLVFMAQNTGSTEVTFLWMHGTLPLALALLIAGVGCALLTMVVGAARITQLRRLGHRQR